MERLGTITPFLARMGGAGVSVVVLVHGPDFACSENLTLAFGARLVSLTAGPDWLDLDPGILLTDEDVVDEARALVDEADLVVLGDALAFHCLARLGGRRWLAWAKRLPLVAFFGDSFYYAHPAFYDGLVEAARVRCLFLLPNLVPLTDLDAVPLHHPMPVMRHEKTDETSIMHAPGRDGKAVVKGTRAIEEVLRWLKKDGYSFEYQKLMYLPLDECLAVKGTAHIVIDQLPPSGSPRGLGRTGLESLAAGSVVLTDLYPPGLVRGYFPVPPAMPVHDQQELRNALAGSLESAAGREALQAEGQAWVAEHVEFKPWREYVERYL